MLLTSFVFLAFGHGGCEDFDHSDDDFDEYAEVFRAVNEAVSAFGTSPHLEPELSDEVAVVFHFLGGNQEL